MKTVLVHFSLSNENCTHSSMRGFEINVPDKTNLMILYEDIQKSIKAFGIKTEVEETK